MFFESQSSIGNLAFQPSDSVEVVIAIVIVFTMVEFCSDQLLVSSDLKWLYSSTILLDPLIIPSHFYKYFLSRVEVNTQDVTFILVNDALNFCNLFVLVKCVTHIDFPVWSNSARFAITECDFKCFNIVTIPSQFL